MFAYHGGDSMIINCRFESDDQYEMSDKYTSIDFFNSDSFCFTFWKIKNRLPVLYSNQALDLLYISLAVFAADRLSLRDFGLDGWSRDFTIHIPVLECDLWNNAKEVLEEMLSFLSGDSWSFIFRPRNYTKAESIYIQRMQKSKMPIKEYDQVCMFSGGLDSFIGAIDLLERESTSTLFVSHYGGGKGTKEYQDILKNKLIEKYNLEKRDFHQYYAKVISGIEETTRTRSFMFFAHAVAVASAFGKPANIIIPENGVISLNIPGTFSRLGTSSTRTTHPHYIYLFQKLLKMINLNVKLVNPYQFYTKGEMITNCSNIDFLSENMHNTMSCSHPDNGRMYGEKKPRHCGNCLPCVIRQVAIKRAGISDRSSYRDSNFSYGETAKTNYNSYMFGLRKFDAKYAFLTIQSSGPIKDHIEEYSNLYIRGMEELRSYLESI